MQILNLILMNLLEKTENHLSLVFHRFLQENQIDIFFNQRAIDFVDPFFISNKATQPKSSDVIFENSRNARIDIKPYIVPYQKRLSQKERHVLKNLSIVNLVRACIFIGTEG